MFEPAKRSVPKSSGPSRKLGPIRRPDEFSLLERRSRQLLQTRELAGSNFPKLAVFECALSSYREPQRALSSPDVRALGPRQPQGLLPPGRCSRPGTRPMKSKFSGAALQHAKVPTYAPPVGALSLLLVANN